MKMKLRIGVSPFVILVLGIATRAGAAGYTFTNIADSNELNFFGVPSVNDAGRAVFYAAPSGGGALSIYSGNGGALTQVANQSGAFSGFAGVSINNAGTVAFNAGLNSGGQGIFTRNGTGPTVTVADTSGIFSGFFYPSINSSGPSHLPPN